MSHSKNTGRTTEALQQYLNEVSLIPLLTVEKERELGYRAKTGDEEAIKTLVESNLRFVMKIAKRYRRCAAPFLDLINEGNIGLIQAARRFDPDREVRFISYAVFWIRQSILAYLSDMSHTMKLPTKVNSLLFKISSSSGTDLHLNEVAEKLGLSEQDLVDMMHLAQRPLSMDQPIGDDELVLQNTLSQRDFVSAEQGMVHDEAKEDLRQAVSTLKANEQQVLNLRFGMDQGKCFTLKEIGAKIGVSRERVRQIQEKALSKLRHSPNARSVYKAHLAGAA